MSEASRKRNRIKTVGKEWSGWHEVGVSDEFRKANPILKNCKAIWANSRFEVQVFECATPIGGVVQLVIARHMHIERVTWHEMLRIKNELYGVDKLGVEIFPREVVGPNFKIRVMWIMPQDYEMPFGLHKNSAWGGQ